MVKPNDSPRDMLHFLLTRIGSWTSSRWDQHLRNEYGDEMTDHFIDWLGYARKPAGEAPELSFFPRMLPPQWAFSCSARMANMGANDPVDCGWPTCGCDPHADKVIEALDEVVGAPESSFAGVLTPHGCWLQEHSSRTCEDGTKGCVREHKKKETDR